MLHRRTGHPGHVAEARAAQHAHDGVVRVFEELLRFLLPVAGVLVGGDLEVALEVLAGVMSASSMSMS